MSSTYVLPQEPGEEPAFKRVVTRKYLMIHKGVKMKGNTYFDRSTRGQSGHQKWAKDRDNKEINMRIKDAFQANKEFESQYVKGCEVKGVPKGADRAQPVRGNPKFNCLL